MQNQNEKEILIDYVNSLTELSIKEIYFDKIKILRKMEEYSFDIVKFIAKDNKDKEFEIFIKPIKKGKIKESLFCICDEFYNRYYKNTNQKNILELQKNLKITEERKTSKGTNKVSIHLFQENWYNHNINFEVFFVDIAKIINNKKKGWVKYLETNQNDILLIGILKNYN